MVWVVEKLMQASLVALVPCVSEGFSVLIDPQSLQHKALDLAQVAGPLL